MAEPYFVQTAGDHACGSFTASTLTAGPWSPALQHGGPPNALAVLLADRAVRAASGRSDLVALRLASDFVGPVPVGAIEVTTDVLRVARSAALVEVTIAAGGRVCLRTRVWFVAVTDTAAHATATGALPPVPPASGPIPGADWQFGYGASLDWRFTLGAAGGRGPAAAWVLARHPVLDESPDGGSDELPGLARAALVADSASGISAVLDWAEWSFVNVDLDIHLARPFVGPWVHMAAATTLGAHGSALARSTLGDALGEAGSGLQTLVVAPITR